MPTVTSAFLGSFEATFQPADFETKYFSFAATDITTIEASNFKTHSKSISLPNTATTSKAVEEAKFSTVHNSDAIATDETFTAADSETYTAASPTPIKATFYPAH